MPAINSVALNELRLCKICDPLILTTFAKLIPLFDHKGNCIPLPMINEAVYTLYEGVGSAGAIDTDLKLDADEPVPTR